MIVIDDAVAQRMMIKIIEDEWFILLKMNDWDYWRWIIKILHKIYWRSMIQNIEDEWFKLLKVNDSDYWRWIMKIIEDEWKIDD